MQDVKVSNSGGIILLGKQGENLARRIRFDLTRWIALYGEGVAELLHKRHGEETIYPVPVTREDNWAVWEVTNTDTALPGVGHCELRYYVDETLAKSETWMAKVVQAMEGDLVQPPAPGQSWAEQIIQVGVDAKEAADAAQAAAEAADAAQTAVETALGDAAWIGFEMDGSGNLYAVLSPGASASFYLDENGYLGVQMIG